jgi:Zn-dependent peptidase ImmA (M78 family)
MHTTRVGTTGPQAPRLVQRLRALTPAWSISHREARWVAEQQAKLLLAEAGITAPPVPEQIVSDLDGVTVYPLAQVPVKGLMGVSKPSSRGGDILIDSTLPPTEQRLTLLHELKHIIDGGHTARPHQAGSRSSSEGLCTDFALSVLMPASWLHADWQAGHRNLSTLAERYEVPVEAVARRLHTLGLLKRRPRRRGRSYCQWRSGVKNTKAKASVRRSSQVTKRKGGNTMKKSNKDNRRAVLYLRVASADQRDQRDGIAQQREVCIREAERLGAVIMDEYVDVGASGNSMSRSGLRGLLRRVADGTVRYVIVRDRTRLARNSVDDAAIRQRLDQAGARLVSAENSARERQAPKLVRGAR